MTWHEGVIIEAADTVEVITGQEEAEAIVAVVFAVRVPGRIHIMEAIRTRHLAVPHLHIIAKHLKGWSVIMAIG